MTYHANIEKGKWWDFGWKLVSGCNPISEGCKNCWALSMDKRFGSTEVKFHPERLDRPLRRKKPAFYSIWNDLFHPSVPFEWIMRVFSKVIFTDERHTYQVLTKRPERAKEFLDNLMYWNGVKVMPNVWLGVTCENQRCADQRIPTLLQIPAAVRFISLEPLLEEITLTEMCKRILGSGYLIGNCLQDNPAMNINKIDWVIVGCESGPKRRPCKLEWVRNIVAQCRAAGVAVFVKQLSISNKVIHDIEQFPEDLRIQEYPEVQSD